MAKTYDAAIIGGALTGTSLFLALADIFGKHKHSLVLADQQPLEPTASRTPRPIDPRVISLGYGSMLLLKEFGLWDAIKPRAMEVKSLDIHYKENKIQVTGGDIGRPCLGWTLAGLEDILRQQALQKIKQYPSLASHTPFTLSSLDLKQSPALIKGAKTAGETAAKKTGETAGKTAGETAAETVGETASKIAGETVDETAGETASKTAGKTTKEQDIASRLIFLAVGGASMPLLNESFDYEYLSGKNISDKYISAKENSPLFAVLPLRLSGFVAGRGYWYFTGDDTPPLNSLATLALVPTKPVPAGEGDAPNKAVPAGEGDAPNKTAPNKTAPNKTTANYIAIVKLAPGKSADAVTDKDKLLELINAIISRTQTTTAEPIADSPAPATFSVPSYLARERLKGPMLLLGNAAHSVEPLGGQNFNLTLWTIAKLRQLLLQQMAQGKLLTSRDYLGEFVKETEATLKNSIKLIHHTDEFLVPEEGSKLAPQAFSYLSASPLAALGHQPLQVVKSKIFSLAAGIRD